MEEVENPKSEARSTKWFDMLTTLSHVEGQHAMTQIQMTKTMGAVFLFGTLEHLCFEFVSSFVLRISGLRDL
jgi:hypothetical protein